MLTPFFTSSPPAFGGVISNKRSCTPHYDFTRVIVRNRMQSTLNPDYTKEQSAAERTRTSTGLLPPAPQAGASTIPPLPHKIYQNKSRIRTDSHRLRAYAGYSPEPGITLRVFQFAPPYPSRLDWTRIRDFHHIFSGVIQISLLPPSPTQGGASNISANSRDFLFIALFAFKSVFSFCKKFLFESDSSGKEALNFQFYCPYYLHLYDLFEELVAFLAIH